MPRCEAYLCRTLKRNGLLIGLCDLSSGLSNMERSGMTSQTPNVLSVSLHNVCSCVKTNAMLHGVEIVHYTVALSHMEDEVQTGRDAQAHYLISSIGLNC